MGKPQNLYIAMEKNHKPGNELIAVEATSFQEAAKLLGAIVASETHFGSAEIRFDLQLGFEPSEDSTGYVKTFGDVYAVYAEVYFSKKEDPVWYLFEAPIVRRASQ